MGTATAPVHVIGVRHHSPSCARLVRDTIASVRPAHVLIEGPVEFSDRIGELALGHTPPVAVFGYVREDTGTRMSWAPFCGYSPEWVALTDGIAAGADVRFVDLPMWHRGHRDDEHRDDTAPVNRYSDAERRYARVTERLCAQFRVDDVDALWDHLVEAHPFDGLADRLALYFDLLRGDAGASTYDTAREEYMASWVRAAVARADGPVVVVVGGFHRPAILGLLEPDGSGPAWPTVPAPPPGAQTGSYLVPYSYRRLDAFGGYQAGMPSPGYYERLWNDGPESAATGLVADVVTRLRLRRQVVSTAALISARAVGAGLAALRGHPHPSRTDVLDGLASALVSDALEQPLPWAGRGPLRPGAHPVVVEVVAALTGDRVGVLHPDTPTPPLVVAVADELAALGLDGEGEVRLDLARDRDLLRSRVLHRLLVLGVPGFERLAGPRAGTDPTAVERWRLRTSDHRTPVLIEAAARGAVLVDAAAATLSARAEDAGGDVGVLGGLLFDAALCGAAGIADALGGAVAAGIRDARDIGALGRALLVALGLWRHDRLLGSAGSPLLGTVVALAAERICLLVEGVRGGPGPANPDRLVALAAVRDAVRHGAHLGLDPQSVTGLGARLASSVDVPPDLRGAGLGLVWALHDGDVPALSASTVPRDAAVLGDWLAGLFAVARDEVLADGGLPALLDTVVRGLSAHGFLLALPALRQAFGALPPSERERFADELVRLTDPESNGPSGRALLLLRVDPHLVAHSAVVEEAVDAMLARSGLGDL